MGPSFYAMFTVSSANGCIIIRYGRCQKCLAEWYLTTTEGQEKLIKSKIKSKKQIVTKQRKELRERKRELNSSAAMKLADTYFSRYIRLKYSIDGVCECYTCSNPAHIKECDNGHYIKREHKATRYEENNCRPQCKTCNGDTKHNGKQTDFRQELVEELGEEEVQRVEQLGKSSIKADTTFYREKADYYREKVKELQNNLSVRYW